MTGSVLIGFGELVKNMEEGFRFLKKRGQILQTAGIGAYGEGISLKSMGISGVYSLIESLFLRGRQLYGKMKAASEVAADTVLSHKGKPGAGKGLL